MPYSDGVLDSLQEYVVDAWVFKVMHCRSCQHWENLNGVKLGQLTETASLANQEVIHGVTNIGSMGLTVVSEILVPTGYGFYVIFVFLKIQARYLQTTLLLQQVDQSGFQFFPIRIGS